MIFRLLQTFFCFSFSIFLVFLFNVLLGSVTHLLGLTFSDIFDFRSRFFDCFCCFFWILTVDFYTSSIFLFSFWFSLSFFGLFCWLLACFFDFSLLIFLLFLFCWSFFIFCSLFCSFFCCFLLVSGFSLRFYWFLFLFYCLLLVLSLFPLFFLLVFSLLLCFF